MIAYCLALNTVNKHQDPLSPVEQETCTALYSALERHKHSGISETMFCVPAVCPPSAD